MKVLRYLLLGVLVILVLVIVGVGVLLNTWINGPLPQHAGELRVAGLSAPVEIIRDENNIPHIYASTTRDLLMAQGFVQAQDRWWQMEFDRHIGAGSLQELTGKTSALLGTDVFIRKAGWYEAAERDYEALDEEHKGYLQAFADGVNAYILSRPASQLATEYNVLGLTGVNIPIEPWTPLDTLVWTKVMAWDLSGNQGNETYRSELLAALGPEMVAAYAPDYAFDRYTTIIQPEDLPAPGQPFAAPPDTAGIIGFSHDATDLSIETGLVFGRGSGIGSNNWVVSGDLTESGMPMLANDPHLGIGMPSIWYEIGLHCEPVSDACPYNVRGFTFAPTPGVVIGHNDRIGWGVTNVGWDTQDLYAIEVNPENPLQYRWNGEWRDMTVREEIIRYGDSDETLSFQVRLTHLGPVINDNRVNDDGTLSGFNNENPLVLHWTATAEVGTIFKSLMMLNKARNWDEFRAALTYWDSPAQNFVYADVDGNIGYQTPSRVPVRAAGHTGLLPVDGTTDAYEWLGYVPFEYLPSVFNPSRGYIATANQALVPFEYYASLAEALADEFGADAHYVFGYEWAPGYRGQRIVDMLEATTEHNLETFRAIHGDNEITLAKEMAPFLKDLDMQDTAANELRDWMLNWDYQMHRDSAQAALFALYFRQLTRAIWNDQLAAVETSADGGGYEMFAISLLLEKPDNPWWDDTTTADVTETRDDILRTAFRAAAAEAQTLLGSDRTKWRWGALHTATFVSNPLGLSGIGPVENLVNRGPVSVSGGSEIVNATGWDLEDFSVRAVPSMRMVLDFSDLSASMTMHTTGQSGHPASSGYGDFIEPWRNIEYHPMRWTREQVEAAAKATLRLVP
jgi:penicillin amidase